MGRTSYGDPEDALASGAVLVALVVVLALLALLVATLVELARVYREHAGRASPIARELWSALAALLGCWLVAAVLAAGGLSTLGAALAAWGFLAYVLVVELLARGQQPAALAPVADPQLDDVLEPWHVTPARSAWQAGQHAASAA